MDGIAWSLCIFLHSFCLSPFHDHPSSFLTWANMSRPRPATRKRRSSYFIFLYNQSVSTSFYFSFPFSLFVKWFNSSPFFFRSPVKWVLCSVPASPLLLSCPFHPMIQLTNFPNIKPPLILLYEFLRLMRTFFLELHILPLKSLYPPPFHRVNFSGWGLAISLPPRPFPVVPPDMWFPISVPQFDKSPFFSPRVSLLFFFDSPTLIYPQRSCRRLLVWYYFDLLRIYPVESFFLGTSFPSCKCIANFSCALMAKWVNTRFSFLVGPNT